MLFRRRDVGGGSPAEPVGIRSLSRGVEVAVLDHAPGDAAPYFGSQSRGSDADLPNAHSGRYPPSEGGWY